jgi:hypothetical protein
MMTHLLQGMIFGEYELIAPLKKLPSIMPTWTAKKHDEDVLYVLRFLSSMSMASVPKTTLEPFQALPPITGLIRWSGWQMVNLTDKIKALMIIRPYFSGRLIDRFLSDAQHPPPNALLVMVMQVAKLFDSIETHYPDLNFDLSPGNLLLDGDMPVLVDCGLAQYAHYHDMDVRSPISSHVEPERGVSLSANYPSMWQIWAATKSAYHLKIKRTDAQYALGALYVYLRTRFLLFEDPFAPFPSATDMPQREIFMEKIKWYLAVANRVQSYEETGQLDLPMIHDEQEKAIVMRAMARDADARFVNCETFAEALLMMR